LGYIHKKEKIESIPLRGNIGQKFIDFFENKKLREKSELENYSETTYEEDSLNKNKLDFITTEEIKHFGGNKGKGFRKKKKLKHENSTDNLIKNKNNPENNLNSIRNKKSNLGIYSTTSILSSLRNSDSNVMVNKNQEHFVQKVKQRLERINRW